MVKLTARWLGIPINVHEEAIPEVTRSYVDRYIAECCYLLENVYDSDAVTIWKFQDFAYDHLLGNLNSPFLLHDHPLQYAGEYLGIQNPTDPRYIKADDRLRDLVQNDEFYKKKFADGWRCGFGTLNPSKAEPLSS